MTSIRDGKEPGGFWVPNDFIDVHAPIFGARGVHLYCYLVRMCTPKYYPTVSQLVAATGLSSYFIKKTLLLFLECSILNSFDMEKIFGSANISSPEDSETEICETTD